MSQSQRPPHAQLAIGYHDDGPSAGWPVIFTHGFPYDRHAFDDVTEIVVQQGAGVIRPYVRGFGPTRFLNEGTRRSGQQAARALDILQLAQGFGLKQPILGGYDWAGNAACAAAALWPEHIGGRVSYARYDVIDVAGQIQALNPALVHVCWYQHLLQTERGRACLSADRRGLCELLWRQWSPQWAFDASTFDKSAAAFDNPDFVGVVLHCYR